MATLPDLSFVDPDVITIPMMAYHLGSDMLHDHGSSITDTAMSLISPPNAIISTNEDRVVGVFMNALRSSATGLQVLEAGESFEIPSSTEMLPVDFKWSLKNDESSFGFVHDAGPLLFRIFEKRNYVTYGTILDSATKPTENRVLLSIPTEVTRDVFDKLGFNQKVGPMTLTQEDGLPSIKAALLYQPSGASQQNRYDMVGKMQLREGAVSQAKKIGGPAGFFASVANTKTALTSDPTRAPLYIIGKALGDALQVASIPSAQRDPRAVDTLIHNTEDRLNFVRCLVFGVPVVYVQHKEAGSSIRNCQYYPSFNMLEATPETTYTGLLSRMRILIKGVVDSYAKVETAAMTDAFRSGRGEYSDAFLAIVRTFKTAILFHYVAFYTYYEQQPPSPDMISRLRNSYSILVDQTSRLVPHGNLFRANGQTLVQKFILCRANPDDCDLGGLRFRTPGGSNLDDRDTATLIYRAISGTGGTEEEIAQARINIKQSITIDPTNLNATLTRIRIEQVGVLGGVSGTSVLDKNGVGPGIRGMYEIPLFTDKKDNKVGPTIPRWISTVGGGARPTALKGSPKRPSVLERPFARKPTQSAVQEFVETIRDELKSDEDLLPGIGENTTSELGVFLAWCDRHPFPIRPLSVLLAVKSMYDDAPSDTRLYDAVPDFGPILTIFAEYPTIGNLQLSRPSRAAVVVPGLQRMLADDETMDGGAKEEDPVVAYWNQYVETLNRETLENDSKKTTGFVSLYDTGQSISLAKKLPSILPAGILPDSPMAPLATATAAGRHNRPPPPDGISKQDWNDALDELEARYNK